jgi:tRNA uridine 5-carbamoylmethylation protein Kti12
MCGAPGSGKSTWLRKNMPKDAIKVSRDEIRFNLIKDNEPYFSKETAVFNEFVRQINAAIADDKDVFADQTSLNRGSRAKLINKLDPKPDETTVVFIDKPLDIILKYNAKRSGRERVPDEVVEKMFNSIQIPKREEGIDKLLVVRRNKPDLLINLEEGETYERN